MTMTKGDLSPEKTKEFEVEFQKFYDEFMEDTRFDLNMRVSGVPTRAGASGYQFVGYTRLERFYRGDQWEANEPPGASQRTDNYCSVIVDNISSLIFDDEPEINCPTDDPSDDLLETKAELKEDLLHKVYEDNDAAVEFDEWSKSGSLYGDGFLKGPFMEKDEDDKWKIRFTHIENPGSVRVLFDDANFKKIIAFSDETRVSLPKAKRKWGKIAAEKGIILDKSIMNGSGENREDRDTNIPMVSKNEFWAEMQFDGKKVYVMGIFIQGKMIEYYFYNWGFIPLRYIKNTYVPNHPYGKSDIEDVIDPQLSHNRASNDLANLLRWISTVNFWGKNIEGMQAMVAGLSRIYSLPDDGELHTFEKPGDPYITNTYVQQRRTAIVDISGISDAMLSSSQLSVSSGRALALAFQGTLRKLNPRMKRYAAELGKLNRDILKLYEIYFPETKQIIEGNYRNKVFLPATILRNVVDTINKFQSGLISLDTAQKEIGVKQPRLEQKLMKKALEDPTLGPQIARQPALLAQLSEGENQPGDQPTPGPGQKFSSPDGAAAANNQQASGAAPTPVTP